MTLHTIKKKAIHTPTAFTWYTVPNEGTVFDYKPGQFSMISLLNEEGSPGKKKAYSMSSSPNTKDYLEFGVRVHGEFTQKMDTLKEGDEIGVEGPYGIFTYNKDEHRNLVIFAGGIGVTPFISMIRYAGEVAPDNTIQMFYFNQNKNEIAYKKDLDTLTTENKNFTVQYAIDKSASVEWKGDVGLINEKMVGDHLSEFEDKVYFMCGPPPFMKAVEKILMNNNVAKEHIKREVF